MKPIPVVFYLGPVQIHTYGIGLALTFLFGYRYFTRRVAANGYPTRWLGDAFVWIVVSAIVGARVFHVVANLHTYLAQPGQILQVWHGGLSSFGGLAFAIPVGIWQGRRHCPQLRSAVAGDLIAPVLVSAWAIGRLLGPQLMVNGGGHPTTAWYGLSYAGQVGKRVPVPLLQAAECLVIFLILLQVEKLLSRRGYRPVGFLSFAALALWDVSRYTDEHFFLAYPGHTGASAVQIGAAALAVIGVLGCAVLALRERGRPVRTDNVRLAPVETIAGSAASGGAPAPSQEALSS